MPDLRLAFVIVLLCLPPPVAMAGDSRPADWDQVSQIFAKRCINCHSTAGAARGLRLDSYAGALAGSEKGAVLVPGDAGNSELIRRLRGQSTPRMPFLSYPLAEEEIRLIEGWIDGGLLVGRP